MTAADSLRVTVGRAERIGTITIVTGSARRLWAGGWRTLALAFAVGGFTWGVQAAAAAMGMNPATPTLSPAYLAYLFLTSVATGLGAALAMRLFLRGPEGWPTFDRALFTGAAVMGGVTFALGLVSTIYATTVQGAQTAAAGLSALAFSVGYCAIAFVLLRLTLWPVAIVMGRPGVTLRAAWLAMRKATRGTILGYLLFAIPFLAVMASRWSDLVAGRQPQGWWQGLFALTGAAYALAVYGMAAAVYAVRVEAPATVADVFD